MQSKRLQKRIAWNRLLQELVPKGLGVALGPGSVQLLPRLGDSSPQALLLRAPEPRRTGRECARTQVGRGRQP